MPHLPSTGNASQDRYNCCGDVMIYPRCVWDYVNVLLRWTRPAHPRAAEICSRFSCNQAPIWIVSLPLLSKAWGRFGASCYFLALPQMKKHWSTLMKLFVLIKLKMEIHLSPVGGITGMAQGCGVLLSWSQLKILRGASLRKFKRSSINHVYI